MVTSRPFTWRKEENDCTYMRIYYSNCSLSPQWKKWQADFDPEVLFGPHGLIFFLFDTNPQHHVYSENSSIFLGSYLTRISNWIFFSNPVIQLALQNFSSIPLPTKIAQGYSSFLVQSSSEFDTVCQTVCFSKTMRADEKLNTFIDFCTYPGIHQNCTRRLLGEFQASLVLSILMWVSKSQRSIRFQGRQSHFGQLICVWCYDWGMTEICRM